MNLPRSLLPVQNMDKQNRIQNTFKPMPQVSEAGCKEKRDPHGSSRRATRGPRIIQHRGMAQVNDGRRWDFVPWYRTPSSVCKQGLKKSDLSPNTLVTCTSDFFERGRDSLNQSGEKNPMSCQKCIWKSDRSNSAQGVPFHSFGH